MSKVTNRAVSINRTAKTKLIEKISDIKIGPISGESPFVKPVKIFYNQNGEHKSWDILKVHDSVAVLIHNISRQCLVAVRQFRPAVYYNCVPEKDRTGTIDTCKYPGELGVTLELCAGLCDKDASNEQIAKEEVLEECGYNVKAESLREIVKFRMGVGTVGSTMTIYYCEVTDKDKADNGPIDKDIIEVVELTVPQVKQILCQDKFVNSPGAFLYCLQWFLLNFDKSK